MDIFGENSQTKNFFYAWEKGRCPLDGLCNLSHTPRTVGVFFVVGLGLMVGGAYGLPVNW
ncbi:hypothetical protein LU293_07325 [Moraxella nasovis]|uniref:hypothetical protein n=1 Tax=Moraxella nasovis TaxID=2904121 RepID=UPI001F6263C8|nr:hypothetical protein [Moraxella nasovis]UNU72898.1 hypothetical protein LU293_07325 [Moraxella nasovis]